MYFSPKRQNAQKLLNVTLDVFPFKNSLTTHQYMIVQRAWLILQVRLILHNEQERSYSLSLSVILPSFCVFFLSLSIHRKAPHHQTQVSMARPLHHFCGPAKGFTWYLLSCFHLAPVTQQKHRQDEKEVVSQSEARVRPGGERWRFKANPQMLSYTPLAFLIKYSFFFFSWKKLSFLEMQWHESLLLTYKVQRRKWATTVSFWQIYLSKNNQWIIGCRRNP